ncbi:LacI family DNA-binding transcriptional regulator [Pseudomonas sp. S3E12]|uniref:LacI family DNA-binding transcriptional regulator n=1 Tax=Pseudomonas sp. S3E12 TaxID=1873126 RepID=UPI0009F22878|nr:LacI family DNA-binding transcriptional regulator [Pseudomonas sp. S3E12]
MNDTSYNRKTLYEVAKLAGVSLSTVSRVLNERGGVSDARCRAVILAAKSLGIKRTLPSVVHGLLRIDLVIVDSPTHHFRCLTEAFLQQAELLRSRLVLQRLIWRETKPEQLLDFIQNPEAPRQGLIVVAHDTDIVRTALIEQIAKGVPVILLTSGISKLNAATYVGVDNFRAGRCAGKLMIKWLGSTNGKILPITNSLEFQAHQQRLKGFLSIVQEESVGLHVARAVECFDNDLLTFKAVLANHKKNQEVVGIYNTGAGTLGISSALDKLNIRPVWVAHEQSIENIQMLDRGILSVVIDQDPEVQAHAAIQHLLFALGDLEKKPVVAPKLHIILAEMIERN